MDITEVLGGLRADDLKRLAKKAGLSKTLTRKDDLIGGLTKYLAADLPGFLRQTSDEDRQFLAEAAHRKGRVARSMYEAKYGVPAPTWGYGRAKDASLIEAVVFREPATGEICIPQELAERLRPMLPKPCPDSVKTVDQVPATYRPPREHRDEERPVRVLESERMALAELRRVLSLVQAGKVRVQDKTHRPTDAAVRLISQSLLAPDLDLEPPAEFQNDYYYSEDDDAAGPVRAHAWAVLVQQCGWCKAQGSNLLLTKAGKDLLGNLRMEALRQGFDKFVADDQFDELNRINHIRGQTGKGKRQLTHPSERRDAICQSMFDWPVNQWITFDEAFRWIFASGGDLTVSDATWGLYFCEPRYGQLEVGGEELERQYVRAFFLESLATLGVVDVGYVFPHWLWPELSGSWGTDDLPFCGRYDGLLYVRLTRLGAYCLGMSETYEPPPAERRNLFQVLPNRELATGGTGQLAASDRAMLELFARQKGDHLWALDAQRILSHVESGGAVEDVVRFLSDNAAEDIPHTVEVFLRNLGSKAGAVTGVEKAILVEMKDAETAALVAHDSEAKKLCRLAGERHLAVPEKNERAFRTALKRLGYVLPQ